MMCIFAPPLRNPSQTYRFFSPSWQGERHFSLQYIALGDLCANSAGLSGTLPRVKTVEACNSGPNITEQDDAASTVHTAP
jgi:hypothetical protein